MGISLDKANETLKDLLRDLKIGSSFRIFGGLGLLISFWNYNELILKISLITFIFGALARAIEILNRLWPKRTFIQFLIWLSFLTLYSLLVNSHIKIFMWNWGIQVPQLASFFIPYPFPLLPFTFYLV